MVDTDVVRMAQGGKQSDLPSDFLNSSTEAAWEESSTSCIDSYIESSWYQGNHKETQNSRKCLRGSKIVKKEED